VIATGLGGQIIRLHLCQLLLHLSGAYADKGVQFFVCLIESGLRFFKNVGERIKFLFHAAQYIPNLCAAFLNREGTEAHVQGVEQRCHCAGTRKRYFVLVLQFFNHAAIDNLAVQALKGQKHDCEVRGMRRINVFVVNILCFTANRVEQIFFATLNLCLVTALDCITQ